MTPQVVKNKGKGSKEENLPSRFAMTQITKGDPVQRSLQNYAKKTPSGVDEGTPNIFGVAHTLP
jgi:hypothetical protein